MRVAFDFRLALAFLSAPLFWLSYWLAYDGWPDNPALATRQIILGVLIYPVLEEIVFRGALQGWLRKQRWGGPHLAGVTVANILASALFSTAHILLRPTLMSASVFVPSLIFGYFRDRYGSLYAPIALHCFYNATFVIVTSL